MTRGRPTKDFRNNWNDQWLPYMRRIATDVLSHYGLGHEGELTEDDLVNEAWIRTTRRVDPSKPCFLMGGWVRREMVQVVIAMLKKYDRRKPFAPNFTYDVEENFLEVYEAKGEWEDFDGVLDSVSVVKNIFDENEREGRIISKRLQGMSYRQIGSGEGISGARCGQIIGKAL